MEFLKKNKKVVIISLIVLAVLIGLLVWWSRRSKAAEGTEAGDIWGVKKSPYAADETGKKIEAKTVEIMNNPEWYNQILAGQAASGYTLQQALAVNAIWALKHDGTIPMDTYGAGEWGHTDYVKKNF